MANTVYAALSIILVIALYVHSGSAISCFVCNSHEKYQGSSCLELTQNSTKSQFYIDCAKEQPPASNKPYVRCRIQVQDVDGDVRVIRSCATESVQEHKGGDCFDRTGTNKIKLRYCECNTNGCNAGSAIYASVFTILVSVVIGWKFV